MRNMFASGRHPLPDDRGSSAFPPDAAARLRSETFVRTVEAHAELGSTNDRALALAAGGVALPAVVLAERQTGGRGRGANRWAAPAGALTFTLLVDPPTAPADASLLAPIAGLTVAEAAASLTAGEVGVKWPNDVLLRSAPEEPWGKLAGILCERPPTGGVAVGVGLNLNCDPAAFPAGLARPAATLRGDGPPHDAVDVLVDLLVRLESAFDALPAGLDPIRWAMRDVLDGRSVTVTAGAVRVAGTACGVTAAGELRVFQGAAVRTIRSGTVAW